MARAIATTSGSSPRCVAIPARAFASSTAHPSLRASNQRSASAFDRLRARYRVGHTLVGAGLNAMRVEYLADGSGHIGIYHRHKLAFPARAP
jgi:hypothetical protein